MEVPEIAGGKVLIKGIAREAGSRTKMAVHSTEVLIDPVGACVGQRGDRVTRVVDELRGEKIDIIKWSAESRGIHCQRAESGERAQRSVHRGERSALLHRCRAGQSAVFGHRQGRSERAPGGKADGLED